jgi:hypothetical protein
MFRRRRGISRLLYKTPSAIALVGVVACSFAIPLPASVSKRQSRPFPCQGHPCGCVDADSCWRECCCFSLQEKLAWAESHGVLPPKFVLAAAKRGAAGKATGCGRACCHAAAKHDRSPNSSSEHAASPTPRKSSAVVMIMALKCRGVHVSVSLMPPSLPMRHDRLALPLADFFPAPPSAPVLYEPPHFAVATPPPDVAAA